MRTETAPAISRETPDNHSVNDLAWALLTSSERIVTLRRKDENKFTTGEEVHESRSSP
jgi:hypothetical protein